MPKPPRATGTSLIEAKFNAALDELVERVKRDRSVLAAMLCGSLSHDTVWEKSDIDLVLVTADDKKTHEDGLCLYADGINVHASLMPRAEFRKIAEGAMRNSFIHSVLAKGRLLYSHDESIVALCERLRILGERDTRIQLLAAASQTLPCLYKARKWLLTRGDLEYTALWILYAANAVAKIELLEAGMLVDREALPQALEMNPALFKVIYKDLLNTRKTRAGVEAALSAIDGYLLARAGTVFEPVIDYLKGRWQAVPGHNPVGALSVLAMLCVILFQAVTGLFANDDILLEGPLYVLVSKDTSDFLTKLHHWSSNVIIALVVLHVAAIVWYAVFKKERLVGPMIKGTKTVEGQVEPKFVRGWVAPFGMAIAAGIVWAVVNRIWM